jgi:hypothetical protein
MEQRRLRLGDILDDYCPRERRVTNHAVVAMIEEDVRQTRCTTCDTEHAYKGAKVPRKRKKDGPSALYKEVLAGLTDGAPPIAIEAAAPVDEPAPVAEPVQEVHEEPAPEPEIAAAPEPEPDAHTAALEDGPVHRRLIRAQLPRIEGQKDVRAIPDFTIRQNGARTRGNGNGHGHFRDRMRMRGDLGQGGANGNRAQRFGGGRGPGSGRPQGGRNAGGPSGFRGGQQRHGGKKGRGPR